ncbi:MAG: hypothetical protein ACLSFT_01420 [Ruminococcus callidus]
MTNFWHSLGNSFLITAVTIVLAVLLHLWQAMPLAKHGRKKGHKPIYFYIVSGMFVPHSDDAAGYIYGTGQPSGRYHSVLVFYMPMNVMLYSGYLKMFRWQWKSCNIDGASTWKTYQRSFSHDEADACYRGSSTALGIHGTMS